MPEPTPASLKAFRDQQAKLEWKEADAHLLRLIEDQDKLDMHIERELETNDQYHVSGRAALDRHSMNVIDQSIKNIRNRILLLQRKFNYDLEMAAKKWYTTQRQVWEAVDPSKVSYEWNSLTEWERRSYQRIIENFNKD